MSGARRRVGWLPLLATLLAAATCGAAEDKPGLLELTAGAFSQQQWPPRPDHPPVPVSSRRRSRRRRRRRTQSAATFSAVALQTRLFPPSKPWTTRDGC